MMLFAAAGSWGEVQPLLALAKHTDGRFACDARWESFVKQHGREPWIFPAPNHDFSIGGFLESLDMQAIFYSLYEASEHCEAIVSSFYLSPAKIVAEMRGIPWIATTTSPIYFRDIGAVSNARLMAVEAKLNAIRESVALQRSDMTLAPDRTIGLYPKCLSSGSEPFPVIGYPRLLPIGDHAARQVAPYAFISTGTINPHDWIEEALEWCDALGVSALYGGAQFDRPAKNGGRHIGVEFDVNFDVDSAMRGALYAVIHGGIGTLCSAIEASTPVVIRPYAFDQFYNAQMLAHRHAALWPSLNPRRVDATVESRGHILSQFDALLTNLRAAA